MRINIKIIYTFLIMALFLILDNTLAPMIKIQGAFPSIVLVFSIVYSMQKGANTAIIIGLFSGALQDIYFVNAFGINMFANLAVCYVAAYLGRVLVEEVTVIQVLTVFIMSLAKGAIVYGLLRMIGVVPNTELVNIAIYNAVVAIPICRFVRYYAEQEFTHRI